MFESANYAHIEHNLNKKVLHNTVHHSLVINIRISRYFLLIILCEFDHLFQGSKLILHAMKMISSHCSQENACTSYQLYLL